jgi:hypothetical protein
MLKVKLFRAIDDLESCKRFAEGHGNVLRDYGVTKVTSAKHDWFYNPGVYVALVLSEDESEVYGGERVHLAHEDFPLPIESAVGIVDPNIYSLVKTYKDRGLTGELCGLWNAKNIAGKGVAILLTKVGVAIAKVLRMDSLFVLCAPYTVSMCQQAGFEIETSIGNQGTFYYPKLDLIATSLLIKDLDNLPHADPEFRKQIFDHVNKPLSISVESGPKGSIEVQLNLSLQVSPYNL